MWLVKQYNDMGLVHHKVYRWKWWAVFIGWLVAGKGVNGDEYWTTVEEVE